MYDIVVILNIQRQMLCFCRALLSKSAIVILDEATASVDPQLGTLVSC